MRLSERSDVARQASASLKSPSPSCVASSGDAPRNQLAPVVIKMLRQFLDDLRLTRRRKAQRR